MTERKPEAMSASRQAPRATHEDLVADMTCRFINCGSSEPHGLSLQSEATTYFLGGFSEHFGKRVKVVVNAVDITGHGDAAERYERTWTLEGVLRDADQWNMEIDVQSGKAQDSLGREKILEPTLQKISYGLHRSDDQTKKTENVQLQEVTIDGKNLIPDFNPALGGNTTLESFLQSQEAMKQDTP